MANPRERTAARRQANAEARRRQVLAAASECFRAHGFHSASMAQISRAARMSAGHIYNYFESKEEIIEAIVEQNTAESMALIDEMQSGEADPAEAVLSQLGRGLDLVMDRENSALELEIQAEATRNPKVAAMVGQADRVLRDRLKSLFLASRGGRDLAPRELTARVELLAAIYQGLMVRFLANPAFDREAVSRVLRQVVRELLNLACPATP